MKKPSLNRLSRLWRLKRLKRLSLVDRPQKAFDQCLDTGEVGEGPVVEPLRLYLLKPLKESRLYWRPPEAL